MLNKDFKSGYDLILNLPDTRTQAMQMQAANCNSRVISLIFHSVPELSIILIKIWVSELIFCFHAKARHIAVLSMVLHLKLMPTVQSLPGSYLLIMKLLPVIMKRWQRLTTSRFR